MAASVRFAATCLRDAGSPRSAHCRATWLSGAPKRRHPAAHPAPGPPAPTTDCAPARQREAAASEAVPCRRLHTTTGAGRGRVQAHLMHARKLRRASTCQNPASQDTRHLPSPAVKAELCWPPLTLAHTPHLKGWRDAAQRQWLPAALVVTMALQMGCQGTCACDRPTGGSEATGGLPVAHPGNPISALGRGCMPCS